jgi:hypothetical protein
MMVHAIRRDAVTICFPLVHIVSVDFDFSPFNIQQRVFAGLDGKYYTVAIEPSPILELHFRYEPT